MTTPAPAHPYQSDIDQMADAFKTAVTKRAESIAEWEGARIALTTAEANETFPNWTSDHYTAAKNYVEEKLKELRKDVPMPKLMEQAEQLHKTHGIGTARGLAEKGIGQYIEGHHAHNPQIKAPELTDELLRGTINKVALEVDAPEIQVAKMGATEKTAYNEAYKDEMAGFAEKARDAVKKLASWSERVGSDAYSMFGNWVNPATGEELGKLGFAGKIAETGAGVILVPAGIYKGIQAAVGGTDKEGNAIDPSLMKAAGYGLLALGGLALARHGSSGRVLSS